MPEPAFTYGARTRDRTELWSTGFAYRAQWQGRGDFALGIQQENYTKDERQRAYGIRVYRYSNAKNSLRSFPDSGVRNN